MNASALTGWLLCTLVLYGGGINAAEENPLKNAKVGDWAEYKMTLSNENVQGKVKQTVTAKDAASVTLRMETELPRQKVQVTVGVLDLTRPYAPQQPLPGEKKIAEGDETLGLGGKEYNCHWIQVEMTVESGGKKFAIGMKRWTFKDSTWPSVKTETTNQGVKTTLEFSASGKAGK